MATNRIPLVIPCHRVVASAGALGGFSSPQGIDMKRRLLELYATTENEQQVARQAAQRTLELAEEIQEMARLKTGISRAPGC